MIRPADDLLAALEDAGFTHPFQRDLASHVVSAWLADYLDAFAEQPPEETGRWLPWLAFPVAAAEIRAVGGVE